jgi:hypothetical protein
MKKVKFLARRKKKNKSKIKRPRGRIRYNVSYEEAKKIVKSEFITSRFQYEKWWEINRPARLPKRPDRAYKNTPEGFKWSEFFGIKNPFPLLEKKEFVSYEECQKFAAKNNIKSQFEWREFLRNNDKPENIPAHPEIVYRGTSKRPGKWVSYNKFFDTQPMQRIRSVARMAEYLIIYKINAKFNNIFCFSQKLCSSQTIVAECKKILENYEIHAIYLVGSYNYRNFLSTHYKEYKEMSNCYIIDNMNDIFFNFDINMENKISEVINFL